MRLRGDEFLKQTVDCLTIRNLAWG